MALLPVETGAVVKGTVTEVGVTVGVIDGVMEAVVVLGALLEVSGIATAVEKVEMSE